MPASHDEPLTIPLRVPARYRRTFPLISAVLVAGCALWIALARSWEAFLFGGLTIGSLAWVWGLKFVLRERRVGTARLILTKEALTSPAFSLSWDRIESVTIGHTPAQTGQLRALNIEPFRSSDIQWKSSLLRFTARLNEMMRMARVQILEVNVDRPLEELIGEFEARAGRRLLRTEGESPRSGS